MCNSQGSSLFILHYFSISHFPCYLGYLKIYALISAILLGLGEVVSTSLMFIFNLNECKVYLYNPSTPQTYLV